MFCWEILGLVILVNVVLTYTTYLSIVSDLFLETVFLNGI